MKVTIEIVDGEFSIEILSKKNTLSSKGNDSSGPRGGRKDRI